MLIMCLSQKNTAPRLVWKNDFVQTIVCVTVNFEQKIPHYFSLSFNPIGLKFALNNPRVPEQSAMIQPILREYRGVKVRKIPLK